MDKKSKIIIGILALLLLAAIGAGTYYYLDGKNAKESNEPQVDDNNNSNFLHYMIHFNKCENQEIFEYLYEEYPEEKKEVKPE